MKSQSFSKPLGIVLQKAGLVSAAQIELALQDQSILNYLRLGEILALRGWIKQETADFFAQKWPNLVAGQANQRIGYYFKSAGLLDEYQIQFILETQSQLKMPFGAIAVLKGWLKPKTVDFFLENLVKNRKSGSYLGIKSSKPPNCQQQVLYFGEENITIPGISTSSDSEKDWYDSNKNLQIV
jgi:hypothetical protein